MKKILAAIIIPTLFLTGCFSGESGDQSTNENGAQSSNETKTYSNSNFSIQFPADWDLIEAKDFTSDIPDETLLVIRNNVKNDEFTANINIVRNNLQSNKSSLDYAKEILNRQRTGLLEYKETKRDIIGMAIGGSNVETYYTEFEARLNPTDPILKFYQIYGVQNQSGFIAMGSTSLNETTTTIEKITTSIKSFKLN